MTNEGQLPMMKNMLRSAKEVGINMSLFHCYILNDQKESATYNTSEFKSITTRKLEVILHNMKLDSEVIWVDNDIVFFENCIQDIKRYPGRFVMQDDVWSPCTGFFLVRLGIFSLKTIRDCIIWLNNNNGKETVNDQHAFNYIYKRKIGMIVSLLPQEEYPNGSVYFNQGKTQKAKMVHCNYLATTSDKEKRLQEHGFWNVNDDAFNLANKYFI